LALPPLSFESAAILIAPAVAPSMSASDRHALRDEVKSCATRF